MYLHLIQTNKNINSNNNNSKNPRSSRSTTASNNLQFKPVFWGKPDEDAEVHLLQPNDWMIAQHFVEGVRVQRFCLTLLREARLWYHSLVPINVDWAGLQNLSRQQYSKVGNTQEQLFHAWRSFYFDENIVTIDVYVTQITQVAALLGYGEPQILEVFKNTLSHRRP